MQTDGSFEGGEVRRCLCLFRFKFQAGSDAYLQARYFDWQTTEVFNKFSEQNRSTTAGR